ncbi:hypothetical protein HK405_001320, partial [Cladochytrium tenue]
MSAPAVTSSTSVEFFAAAVPAVGAAPVVVARSLPLPPRPGDAVVRVTATSINPVDWKLQRGLQPSFFDRAGGFPAVLGSDAAGEVTALGPDAPAGLHVGDRVFFQGLLGDYDGSTFQQFCRVPADLLAHTPPNVSDDQAAGISLATVAAAVSLYDERMGHGLPPPWVSSAAGAGRAIVVLGGAASVGQYAVQLARLSGFTRIVANAGAANCELVKSLGAHVVLDRSTAATADDYVR